MKKTIFYLVLLLLMGCKHSIETPTPPPEVQPLYPCTLLSKETFGCATPPSVSCQKPTGDSATLRCLIVGTWDWVWEGSNSVRRYDLTPQSAGYRLKMTFRKDGIVEHFKNDTLRVRSPYKILYLKALQSYGIQLKIEQCNDYFGGIGALTRICNDTLFFDYAIASDAFGNQKWEKIK
jgi:hypothetical protein